MTNTIIHGSLYLGPVGAIGPTGPPGPSGIYGGASNGQSKSYYRFEQMLDYTIKNGACFEISTTDYNDYDEINQWCADNINKENYCVFRIYYYIFNNLDDAALFKLKWDK